MKEVWGRRMVLKTKVFSSYWVCLENHKHKILPISLRSFLTVRHLTRMIFLWVFYFHAAIRVILLPHFSVVHLQINHRVRWGLLMENSLIDTCNMLNHIQSFYFFCYMVSSFQNLCNYLWIKTFHTNSTCNIINKAICHTNISDINFIIWEILRKLQTLNVMISLFF